MLQFLKRLFKPMRYKKGQTVLTAVPIEYAAITIPANKEVKIIHVDPIFKCYDVDYQDSYITDCNESDFKPKE